MEKYSLIRTCDICGIVNAVDLDGTPERWKELQKPDHTVTKHTEAEARKLWSERAGRCDHKSLIAHLRAQVDNHNTSTIKFPPC
jgi:hypothetical protein